MVMCIATSPERSSSNANNSAFSQTHLVRVYFFLECPHGVNMGLK